MSKSERDSSERIIGSIGIGAKMVVDLMRQSQKRTDIFITHLIPLLSDEAKRKIVAGERVYYKFAEITDEELLN